MTFHLLPIFFNGVWHVAEAHLYYYSVVFLAISFALFAHFWESAQKPEGDVGVRFFCAVPPLSPTANSSHSHTRLSSIHTALLAALQLLLGSGVLSQANIPAESELQQVHPIGSQP